ncbi:polyisoprenoid-binding protein [Nocardioides silvaticus]|uniref:Polyisoprenoid-binding protein n=1 Tax=Nocardioides silvaticus TaxID=2201891 RepID=A0A316TDI8_9ACTN|nr:YceI family protein [Nocardioides silvaticus]PWN02417.1 polyisoprenoid-binding protein [Nocardioides silvaticus]
MTTLSTSPDLAGLQGDYVLDADHTRIGFVARHAMVTKVRGAFTAFEGRAAIAGDDLSGSRVALTIQAASIDTRNAQRDEHLRSNDFLAMDQFPTITFVSTEVRRSGPTTVAITGDLTIKDVTRSVTVPFEFGGAATDPDGDFRIGFEGSVVINRKDFGITWNAALETGGVLVGDKIVLELDVAAVRTA